MGEVYAALDHKLRRRVALKVVPSATAADPERLRRFQREARTLATLSHPQVVTIHSVEEDDGLHFLTMELVEGETLQHHIPPTGLSPAHLLSLARPMAAGLAAAHARGIVHRDLKPANVMVTPRGDVKILDFGLARGAEGNPRQRDDRAGSEAANREKEEDLTTTRAVAKSVAGGLEAPSKDTGITGTVPYMAPEQLRGEAVGPAADIFAFGVLLYEMASGRHPFTGGNIVELAASILRDPMPPLQGEGFVVALAPILERCLAKDPGRRWTDAGELEEALAELERQWTSQTLERPLLTSPDEVRRSERKPITSWRFLLGFALLLVVLLGGAAWWPESATVPGATGTARDLTANTGASAAQDMAGERKMIAVLPFRNLGHAEDAYFAAGVSEEITSRLTLVDGLGVVSRTSAQRFAAQELSSRAIGEALGVDYLLSGTVRWVRPATDGSTRGAAVTRSRVRVTPELVRVSDDLQVWSAVYDRVLEDLFEVQSDIASQVIRELDLTLFPDQREAIDQQPTDSLEAYQAYLKGLHALRLPSYTYENTLHAQSLFEQAIALDPNFTLAWAQLSSSHARLIHFGWDRSPERLELARNSIARARQLDPDHPEVRLASGYYHYWALRDYESALRELQVAKRGLPGSPAVLAAIAFVERRLGRFERSTVLLEQTRELDPADPQLALELGTNYTFLHQVDPALENFERALELLPDNGYPHILSVYALWMEPDRLSEARRHLEQEAARAHSLWPWMWFWQLVYEGDIEGALDHLGGNDEPLMWNHFYHPPALLRAQAASWLGRHRQAEREYRSAVARLEANPEVETDPRLLGALGVARAGLGDEAGAIDAGRSARDRLPRELDAILVCQRQVELAWIFAKLGHADQAISELGALVQPPSRTTPALLERDPRWRPLVGHPGFASLLAAPGTQDRHDGEEASP